MWQVNSVISIPGAHNHTPTRPSSSMQEPSKLWIWAAGSSPAWAQLFLVSWWEHNHISFYTPEVPVMRQLLVFSHLTPTSECPSGWMQEPSKYGSLKQVEVLPELQCLHVMTWQTPKMAQKLNALCTTKRHWRHEVTTKFVVTSCLPKFIPFRVIVVSTSMKGQPTMSSIHVNVFPSLLAKWSSGRSRHLKTICCC